MVGKQSTASSLWPMSMSDALVLNFTTLESIHPVTNKACYFKVYPTNQFLDNHLHVFLVQAHMYMCLEISSCCFLRCHVYYIKSTS